MIEVTTIQFAQNPNHYQALAKKEPVLVHNNKGLEVLLDYNQKPFVSLYDKFVNIASQFSNEERAILADIDDEADFSALNGK